MKTSFTLACSCLVLLLIQGCSSKKEALVRTPDATTWTLEYITGLSMNISGLYPNQRPRISFDNQAMILSGNNGCNDFSIPYTSSGNSLHLAENGKQTMRACPGPGEPHFMQQLKVVDSFNVTNNGLFLYGKKVPLMRFKKVEE